MAPKFLFNHSTLFLILLSIGFWSCSPNHIAMEEDLGSTQPTILADGDVDSTPDEGYSCSGRVMYSVPYDASVWGPVENNSLRVRIFPESITVPIEPDCDCEEIVYFVVFDLPPTAIQQGAILQPGTNAPAMSYESFVVEESPSSNPGPYWQPPIPTLDPYPFTLETTIEVLLEVNENYPIGPMPENKVARVVGICIVGDIPDLGTDAIHIDFEHVPGP